MWLNVYMTFSHYVNMSLCHLHIVCKLCVSSAHCVQIVCVLLVNVSVCQCHFCHVNMLYGHCMPCHYVQCHMAIVMLWPINCGLSSYVSQTGLVLWSGHLRFYATYLRLSSHCWSMCGLGCLHFSSENVNSCVWGYESLSSQNVKMSPVKLGLYVQCEGYLLHLWRF